MEGRFRAARLMEMTQIFAADMSCLHYFTRRESDQLWVERMRVVFSLSKPSRRESTSETLSLSLFLSLSPPSPLCSLLSPLDPLSTGLHAANPHQRLGFRKHHGGREAVRPTGPAGSRGVRAGDEKAGSECCFELQRRHKSQLDHFRHPLLPTPSDHSQLRRRMAAGSLYPRIDAFTVFTPRPAA